MVVHSNNPQTRHRDRVFYFNPVFSPLVFLKTAVLIFAALVFQIPLALAEPEGLDSDQARQQCFKGQTIYCLALGISEERAGQQERALELYRTGCVKHPTPGHLRACTPLLNLAWKMNRLDEEVAPLENKCKEGSAITCYYLGKEYLKITQMDRAIRHLDPLCRKQYQPPVTDDFGPCYHLAKAFEQTGHWNRAKQLYQLGCEAHIQTAQPNCEALKELVDMEKVHRELAQKEIRKFYPGKPVLLFVVLMSFLHVGIWFKGGRVGIRYLNWLAPIVIMGGALAWTLWPEKPAYPPSQWVVIFFTLLQAMGMAVFAYRKMNVQ